MVGSVTGLFSDGTNGTRTMGTVMPYNITMLHAKVSSPSLLSQVEKSCTEEESTGDEEGKTLFHLAVESNNVKSTATVCQRV